MAKGTLIARNVSRRMSPTTGLDTGYVYEWRVQSEPGTQYPYSVHRIFTKNGEQQEDSVMSVGQTKNEAIRDLYAHSVETVLNQAEKLGLFKSLYTREESKKKKDAEKKRLAEERQVREDAENSERFNRVFSPLRTLKGLKEGEIQIDVFKSNDFKERGKRAVKGYDVGNGVGVAIEGEGRYRGYTVTHLNTGLAMGSSFNKRDEAVALARAVSKIANWSKWQTEKAVPKSVMNTAASLVRAARSKLLGAKLEKALETGAAVKPKQEVKLVSPAAGLQWSEPKAKLEKIADEFRKYYGKKVTIYGGGGAPPSTAILQRVELHPTILKGKDGYTLKAYVKGADSKILPTDKGGEWDFWLGSWQIAVNPKQVGKAKPCSLPIGLSVKKVRGKKGGYEVIHTKSGNRLLPFTYPERELATDFARRAGQVGVNWTRPFPELQKESEKIADLIRGGKKPGMFGKVLDMPTTFPKSSVSSRLAKFKSVSLGSNPKFTGTRGEMEAMDKPALFKRRYIDNLEAHLENIQWRLSNDVYGDAPVESLLNEAERVLDDLKIAKGMSAGEWGAYIAVFRKSPMDKIPMVSAIRQAPRAGEASLQAIHDSRSPRSKESDERQSNADTIEPDDPRVKQWVKDQGRMDVVGIDTPKKHRSKKVARKTRKSTRTETQVRGVRR